MSNLSKTDLQVLKHHQRNEQPLKAVPSKGLLQMNINKSQNDLVAAGLLTPASKGRFVISNKGETTLKALEKDGE